jgi:ABC-2 type transport system permease protein
MMRNILTITGKEFRGYFNGPTIYIVAGLFSTFLSFTFFMLLRHFSQKSTFFMMQTQGQGEGLNLHNEVMVGLISNINLILLILIPFLTVRLFAEEKKMRTFDLLLTSPITSAQIVIGKYLAGLFAVWLLISLSFIYPVGVSFFAEIQWGPLVSAYIGLFLIAAMYVAIGIFASSLTESVILAGFIAIILSLGLWFIAWSSIVVENPIWTSVLEHLSVSHHFGEFVKGSLQLVGLVFTLSIVAVYCFLTERVVESARWR